MPYLAFLLFSYSYLSSLRKYRSPHYNKLVIYSFPVILFWCVLIGGQNGVGTDYFAYMDLFSGGNTDYFTDKGEFLFTYFVKICNCIGIEGQGVFFLMSFIWILMLLYIMQCIVGSKRIYLFLFVLIVFSGTFHNQMNTVRQFSATYIYTLGVCFLYQRRFFLSALLLCAMCFVHGSAITMLPFALLIGYVANNMENHNWLYLFVGVAFFLSIFLTDGFVGLFIPYFEQYAGYYNSGALEETIELLNRLTKYINIPLMLYSIYLYPRMGLNKIEKAFFVTGVCAYSLKISLLSIMLIARIGQYSEILLCIPLVFMLEYLRGLHTKAATYKLVCIISYLLIPYILKVTCFAFGEYAYKSVFFN